MLPVISDVRVAAGHDGAAELKVTLRHGNGGLSDVTLDAPGAAALFQACGTRSPEELLGQGWDKVREALSVSWNRYQHNESNGDDPCPRTSPT